MMSIWGNFLSHFILTLLCVPLFLTPASLAHFLKNCSIDYQRNPTDDLILECGNSKLVTIPDDLPKNAVSVNLLNNKLTWIKKEDFGGLTKLRHLNLQHNDIARVDSGSFSDLETLKRLHISSNKITNLTCDIFQGLSNLTELLLDRNEIQVIPACALRFLTSLLSLDLSSNMIQQVTDIQPVLQLSQLQILNIRLNQLSSFETKDLLLNESSNLRVLDVSFNKLEKFSITTPIFPYLQRIDLSQIGGHSGLVWDITNKTLLENITQLYLNRPLISFKGIQTILHSLDSLTHLRLNYMDELIKKGLLSQVCKIPTLRQLDVFFNNFSFTSIKLSPCSGLRRLDLSLTSMSELPKGSIQSMKQLQFLSLEGNFLRKVPDDIRSLGSLQILRLNSNIISRLSCEDFFKTIHLRELTLSNNHISKLDKCVFKNLSNLTFLDLSDNLIWTIESAFQTALHQLEVLNISQNTINIIEGGDFRGLRSLQHLDVVSDKILRVYPEAFDGLINLQTLAVSLALEYEPKFCKLQHLENLTILFSIPDTWKSSYRNNYKTCLKSLRSFTVICNGYHYGFPLDVESEMLKDMKDIEEFTAVNIYVQAPKKDTFEFNHQLKSLTIMKTDLSDLDPELFHSIPHLQVLTLSECGLTSLDFVIRANLTALRYLKLSDNEIAVINETVFQSLPALTYLDVANNPFTCDCSNAGFIHWVRTNQQTLVVNAHQYTCSFPVDSRGSMLLDFDIQLCWGSDSFLCFIFSFCLVVATLLASFIYRFMRWQISYSAQLFLAFLYNSRKKMKECSPQFDAFVSYNTHDEDWVYQVMLPELEEEQGLRLCLHHRDFQPGKPIIDNITDAIYGSRKTICVISRHYLQSEWCSREIQMASFRLFDEKKDVLILLFLEEIHSYELSPYYRMRKMLKKRTYFNWPQAVQHPRVFWQNLKRALQTAEEATENENLLTGPRN
ncbi:unnamed protein product [Menidia menidia]|uniref:(Atlantic silverside) hypothetical protein n=1 Tax=Menidia menidia TaxID=238744 RepID=A0A8S4AKG9_9TELE|nr:unnamed protein product [Menidia menidia]